MGTTISNTYSINNSKHNQCKCLKHAQSGEANHDKVKTSYKFRGTQTHNFIWELKDQPKKQTGAHQLQLILLHAYARLYSMLCLAEFTCILL